MTYTIYSLKFPNGKLYIGKTSNLRMRLFQHKNAAKSGRSLPVCRAIREHGWENVVAATLETGLTDEAAKQRETDFIREHDSVHNGYNDSPGLCAYDERRAERTRKMMAEPERRARALVAMHSPDVEARRIVKLKSPETRAINSAAQKRVYDEGRSGMPDKRRSVFCIETRDEFDSVTAAAKHFGGRREHLRDHLKGKQYRKKFKGYTFRYAEAHP